MKATISAILLVSALGIVRGDVPPTQNFNSAAPNNFNPSVQQQQPVVPQTNAQTSAPADKDFGFVNPNTNQQGYYYYYYPVKDGVSASTGHHAGGASASTWGSELGTGFGDLGSSWTSLGVLGDVALGVSLIVVVVLAILLIYPNFAEWDEFLHEDYHYDDYFDHWRSVKTHKVNARALSEVATPERMSRLATFVMDAIDKYQKKYKNN